MRKTSGRVEKIAHEVNSKALPMIETAQTMLVEVKPRVTDIIANAEQSARIGSRPDGATGRDRQRYRGPYPLAGHSRR